MSGGFGTGPFGLFPLGEASSDPPVSSPTTLPSSRKIDGSTGQYVIDADGNYEAMNDTDQRVLLIVSFADVRGNFITAAENASREAKIRAALAPLMNTKAPDIKNLVVTVTTLDTQTTGTTVKYTNLSSGKTQTVTFGQ